MQLGDPTDKGPSRQGPPFALSRGPSLGRFSQIMKTSFMHGKVFPMTHMYLLRVYSCDIVQLYTYNTV